MFDRTVAAEIFEGLLVLSGIILAWRLVWRPGAAYTENRQLPTWACSGADFLTFLLFTIGFWFFGGVLGALIIKTHAFSNVLTDDTKMIVASAASQLGMLAGVAAYALTYPAAFALTRLDVRRSLLTGGATFLIAQPFVYGAGFVWLGVLKLLHLPVEKQPAIELFTRTKGYGWLAFLIIVAAVMAPVAEEMIFRAGFFRYLRTRIPRGLAFIAPACLFAALHQNLASFGQLVALAVVFAAAYERTGQIGTSIVAHALFNLNTVLLLLLGVDF